MGQTLTHGIYLPDEGERNCYDGLASNWSILDGAVGTVAEHTTALAGKAPAVHTHGNITNDGKVGTTANLPLITGTGGVVQAGSFGTAANTFCEGNDSRLSDARTPVAHTHTKSDVTDLFNSANTWTDHNTYTKYIYMQNSSIEIGNAPSNNTSKEITFTDKNNATLSRVLGKTGSNGESYIALHACNKYLNGAIDPNGTNVDSFFYVGIDATGNAYNVHKANTYPENNNSYDLGISGKQWNNLYAKNYYYNGTAWGLDKYNWWSLAQFYAQNSIHVRNVEPGVVPSSEVTAGFRMENANASYSFGDVLCRVNTGGTTYINLIASNKFSNGALDPNGTPASRGLQVGIRADGTGFLYTDCGWRNNLVPHLLDSGVANLGTSTLKWKSFNGVNPGALSLPDDSSSVSIDTTNWNVSGGFGNAYTPASNGWLHINIKDTATNSIFVFATSKYSASVYGNGSQGLDGRLALMIPVLSGVTYAIIITAGSVSEIYTAKFFPCKGNV